jgi:hypothetical protein
MHTLDQIKEYLSYESDTGTFYWVKDIPKRGIRPSISSGSIAGYLRPDGYVMLALLNKNYLAHRVAILFMTGEWPNGLVDHINGNPSDNRAENLRVVSHKENIRNQRRARGVYPNGKRFKSGLSVDGKYVHLGTFDTQEQAHQAYLEAKRQLHGVPQV